MRPTTQRADRPSIWSASAKSEDVQILVGVRSGPWLLRKRRLIYALHHLVFEIASIWEQSTNNVPRLASSSFSLPPLQWWTNYSHCLNGPWCKRLWAVMNVQIHWKFWFNEVCLAKSTKQGNFTDSIHSLKLQSLCLLMFTRKSLVEPYWLVSSVWNECKHPCITTRYVVHPSPPSLPLMMSTYASAFWHVIYHAIIWRVLHKHENQNLWRWLALAEALLSPWRHCWLLP